MIQLLIVNLKSCYSYSMSRGYLGDDVVRNKILFSSSRPPASHDERNQNECYCNPRKCRLICRNTDSKKYNAEHQENAGISSTRLFCHIAIIHNEYMVTKYKLLMS